MTTALMMKFAQESGLTDANRIPKRYLWTDAFAVCNFLGLYLETDEAYYKELSLRLVDQVHTVLGQYAQNDPREGWISGLNAEAAALHPTKGGLRIGKPLPERGMDAPYDAQAEWDRDGQYFHYLTKWMHALSRVTQVTGDPRYNRWAIELAQNAHEKFSYFDEHIQEKRLVWKMSIDLDRALVPSMGQHDALDAWIVYNELQRVEERYDKSETSTDLQKEIAEAERMAGMHSMLTDDPLGIGGLLSDAYLSLQTVREREDTARKMLQSGIEGFLRYLEGDNRLSYPAEYRLAFRELGLAIGLKSMEKMHTLLPEEPLLAQVSKYSAFAADLIRFWQDGSQQSNNVWTEHRDINSVMLATALSPEGYLELNLGE